MPSRTDNAARANPSARDPAETPEAEYPPVSRSLLDWLEQRFPIETFEVAHSQDSLIELQARVAAQAGRETVINEIRHLLQRGQQT